MTGDTLNTRGITSGPAVGIPSVRVAAARIISAAATPYRARVCIFAGQDRGSRPISAGIPAGTGNAITCTVTVPEESHHDNRDDNSE